MDLGIVLIVGAGCAAVAAVVTAVVCRSNAKMKLMESERRYESEMAAKVSAYESQIVKLSTELSSKKTECINMEAMHQKAMAQLKETQEEQRKAMIAQMKVETEAILKQRSDQLSQGNKSDMDGILKPLRQSILDMQKAMKENEESHIRNTVSLSKQLEQAVKDMEQKTADIGAKADNLSDALTSRPKVQGCFGENFLDTMLANENLVNGVHYTREVANDDRSRPDFVFHFKEGLEQKDLIVDSKVSLTAFVDYVNAEDEHSREVALTNHLKSVHKHIDELSAKDYAKKVKNPFADYVVMFMPVGAALQVAMDKEPMLWRDAYQKGVLITTEQTIMPFLKIINLTWKKFNHDTNLHEITKAAENMIERVGAFYDSYRDLGSKLKSVCNAYNSGVGKLRDSGQSITTSARQVMEIGVRRKGGKAFVVPDEMISTEKLPLDDVNSENTVEDLF